MKYHLLLLIFWMIIHFVPSVVSADTTEVTVFAAASLTESLTEIGEVYVNTHPEIEFVFNFDSSGTLKTQIEEGAVCDLFLSAASAQMDALDITMDPQKNPERLDLIRPESRRDLLENRVVLTVSEGNPAEVHSFADLAERLNKGGILFAMGGKEVPVGQYTQKILSYLGLDESALARSGQISYGSNVKELTTQIREGLADCAVVYQTDAVSANLEIVDTATEEMCGQVIYPVAILKDAPHAKEAAMFLDALYTPEAAEIFKTLGFTLLPVPEEPEN